MFILTHGHTRARDRERAQGGRVPGRDPDREPRRELGLADRVARPASDERTAVESPEISTARGPARRARARREREERGGLSTTLDNRAQPLSKDDRVDGCATYTLIIHAPCDPPVHKTTYL